MSASLAGRGWELYAGVLSPLQIENMKGTVFGYGYGYRRLLELGPIQELANSACLMQISETALGGKTRPVKATLFDKMPAANWKVPFHQDRFVAVKEIKPINGFSQWSLKDGIHHVQPPAEVLERMVALRIHLDDCPAENGALRFVCGSHLYGILSDSEIPERIKTSDICEAWAGDVLAMFPLVLHASSPSKQPHHRRVIHIEYAAGELPEGLQWAW